MIGRLTLPNHFAKVHLDFGAHRRSRLGVGVVGVVFEGGVVEDVFDLRRRAGSSLSTHNTLHTQVHSPLVESLG